MAILFNDNFNRADEDPLSNGGKWTTDASGYKLVTNAARRDVTVGFDKRVAWVDTDGLALRADMNVQCRIRRTNAGGTEVVGICARRTATNTYYAFHFQAGSDTLRLFKMVGGVFTELSVVSVADTTTFHKFRLEVFGNQLKVFRDNAQVIGPITDNAITAAGSGGILGENTTAGANIVHFDDFFIGDESGDMIEGQIAIDHLIPLDFRTQLNADQAPPLLLRLLQNYDLKVPTEWDICKVLIDATLGQETLGQLDLGGKMHCMMRADQVVPLRIRSQVNTDHLIPLFTGLPGALTVDFVIPLALRLNVSVDHVVAVLWVLFTDWLKQAASQSAAWTPQGVGAADAWIKQGAGQPDAWTKV